MTTDYNQGQTATQYKKAKEQPWRTRIEAYSLMKQLGDLEGNQVVDLACGEGHFTRKLRQAGAAHVVGEDISERMIELARDQEARAPLGIEYRVEDACTLTPQQDFDLAVSAWLLVYAHDRAELAKMCQGLARRLRPGGRFLTFTANPDIYAFRPAPDYRKYGFTLTLAENVYEGAPIVWTFHLGGSSLAIENYYLPLSAYESAFREAGFREFRVHRPELSPDLEACDEEYWAEMLDYPPAVMFDCIKA